ncbi:hypothetical protein [Tunturiibacter gelidiferens]|uniref:hypothetical protein n=1 Tax=Tunturiibacter gelidiferens TaxID=3069689 RepID=UPI003D9B115B
MTGPSSTSAPVNRIESSVLPNLHASAVILSGAKDPEAAGPATNSLDLSASTGDYDSHEHTHPTTPPQQGIAPDLAARSGLTESGQRTTDNLSLEDRGIYHASDAMKSMYEMGDSPSCATCGAIMTRSGSCYRCMSCGSTSGCS